jgi:hypothetical protein
VSSVVFAPLFFLCLFLQHSLRCGAEKDVAVVSRRCFAFLLFLPFFFPFHVFSQRKCHTLM